VAATPNRPDETHDPILRGPRSLDPDRARRSAPQRALDFNEAPLPRAPKPLRAQARRRKLAGRSTLVVLLILAAITGSLAGLTLIYSVNLPQISDLERYRPSTTTDLYDRNGKLIGSFALQRRQVVDYDGFAPVLRQAVISVEDKNFESHWGINVFRVAGAAWHDIRSHGRAQGASTLTMQLARNLFLSDERTAGRKVQEAFLAIQIERTFTKEQIFTLYGNQIYLGSGNYGFEAASEYFFSKHAKDLNLTEAALLAGLPKGPVGFSPILNPDRALKRRNLVISEMEADGVITHAQAQDSRSAPLGLRLSQPQDTVAPWFQEEVRRELEKQFGSDQVHEAGLRVDTTLDMNLQQTADRAVEDGVAAYERRHGWKGHLENVVAEGQSLETYSHPDWAVAYGEGDYVHALVTRVLPLEILARIGPVGKEKDEVLLMPQDWQWTGQRYGTDLVKPGDIIYVQLTGANEGTSRRASLEEDSGAQGSLLAVDNTTGDVLAMVGGRDYELSVFNRATQAERQTGSSFKPYVYTAAIEAGVKPTDIVMDTPVSFGSYVPHNYENDFKGAMTVANAFAESRNIPALRLAARVGIHNVIDLAHKFGVTSNIPPYLPVALGAAEITLQEQVASYSVFPNDGLRITPRLIRKVSNADGITMWSDNPSVTQVIDQQTARTMMTLLEGVTQHGTGAAAKQLNHPIGGKTGTTSDFTDAWFLGFSPSVTCGVWIGYDSRQSLGKKETGAQAALPIWMTFMKQAIVGKDDEKFPGDVDSTPETNPNRAAASPAEQALTANRPPVSVAATPRAAETVVQPHAAEPAGAVSPGAVPTRAVPSRPAPGITTTAPVASSVKSAIARPPVAKPASGGAMRSFPAPAARSAPAPVPVARNFQSSQPAPIRGPQPVVPVRSTFPPAMLRAMQQAPAGAHVFHYLPAGKGPRTVVVVPHPPRVSSAARAAVKPRQKTSAPTASQGALLKPAMPQSHSATQLNGPVRPALN
jgi:penicillin-binding protein 1A